MNIKLVWAAGILIMTLWLLGACAEPSQASVTAPLLGDDRSVVQSGNIPQQLVVILVTPTPAQVAASGGGDSSSSGGGQQVAQAPSGGSESGGDAAQGQQVSEEVLIQQGESIYASNCAMCHGPNGQGGGSFPPLAGSTIATSEDPSAAITTVLQGRGQMPSFGEQFTDEQVASVLSYVRNSFGNSAPAVQVSDVAQVSGQGGQQQPAQEQSSQQQSTQQQPAQQQSGQPPTDQQAAQQQSTEQQSTQQQNAQQGSEQGASTTVSTQGGQITLQIQIVVMTPEPGGATQVDAAQPAAAPTPAATATGAVTETGSVTETGTVTETGEVTQTGTVTDSGTMTSTGTMTGTGTTTGTGTMTSTAQQPASETGGQTGDQSQQQGSGGQQANAEQLASLGQEVYTSNCAMCHGPEGQGGGSYPALAGSPVVTGEDPSAAITTVVQGRGQMPSFKGQLSSEQIAAVLTYVRGAWDNNASPVQIEQVEQVGGGQAQQSGQQPQQNGQQPQASTGVTSTAGTTETTAPTVSASPTAPTATATSGSGAQEQVIQIRVVVDGAGNVQVEQVTGETQAATGGQRAAPQATPAPQATSAPAATGTVTSTEAMTGTGTMTSTETVTGTSQSASGQSASETGQSSPEPGNDQINADAEEQSASTNQAGSEDTSQAAATGQVSMAEGSQLFMRNCAACHQVGGQGIEGVYPALAGSPFVTAQDPQPVIQVVTTGRAGMPSFGPYLTSGELAAIISYIRSAWGNNAAPVSQEQVQQIVEMFRLGAGGEGH